MAIPSLPGLSANFCGAIPFPSVSENKKAVGAFFQPPVQLSGLYPPNFGPVIEGDQRDSAIDWVTLLVESDIGIPVKSFPGPKEINGRQHIKGKRTALDLFPLKLD